jgi:hypothetical protein
VSGFSKLFSSIITSSVWCLPDSVRVVWISLVAMADRNGMVEASIGGLARAANVSREVCEGALSILESPDADDRSGVDEGRRIRKVQGGWLLTNYAAYREKGRGQDRTEYLRLKKRESRERQQTVNKSTNVNRNQPIAEADADADAVKKSVAPPALPAELDTAAFREAWEEWIAYRRERRIAPYVPSSLGRQFKRLAKMGEARAIAAIDHSIAQNSQGVYEPTGAGRSPKGSAVVCAGSSDAEKEALRSLGRKVA